MVNLNQEVVEQIHEVIKESEHIIIHRHKRPDPDAMGAQMALKEYLKINFPATPVYAVGEEGAEEFSYLGNVDKVNDELFPKSTAIIVDTANTERIEDNRYQQAKKTIKIDHHIFDQDDLYADINLIDPTISSSCELLFYIFDYLNQRYNYKLNAQIAKALFCGIYSDTGGFIFSNVTEATFYAASQLIKYPFDYEDSIVNLTTISYNQARAIGYALSNLIIQDGIGYIDFSHEVQEEEKLKPNDISVVSNFLGKIKELRIWVVFNHYPSFIRVNLRSRAQIDIQEVAKVFGGGGHKNASGATLSDSEQIKDVIAELKKI